jgi:peptidoglycan-N-acetylglucosamine deacetylase
MKNEEAGVKSKGLTRGVLIVLITTGIGSLLLLHGCAGFENKPGGFSWPNGKKAAVTITFDDSIPSQYETAAPLMKKHGLVGTYFMMGGWWFMPGNVEKWREIYEEGNEIALHSFGHPCDRDNSGNTNGISAQDYTLEKIRDELKSQVSNAKLSGFGTDFTYAYPCGVKWVGEEKKSYVPVVKKLFVAARDLVYDPKDAVIDPLTIDLAQVPSVGTDGKEARYLIGLIEEAKTKGGWVVFYVHGVGSGWVITDKAVFEEVIAYIEKSKKDLWVSTFKQAAEHIKKKRTK